MKMALASLSGRSIETEGQMACHLTRGKPLGSSFLPCHSPGRPPRITAWTLAHRADLGMAPAFTIPATVRRV